MLASWLIGPLLFASVTSTPHSEYTLDPIDGSFSSPLYVTAPENDDRVFVVERGGRVRLVENGALVGTYLSVAHLLPSSPGSEQGLLGLAFHPDFDSNGQLFLSYINSSGNLVITQVTVDPSASSVSVGNRQTVLVVPQFASNHNGGMILFGPDDYLYIGTGDGGGGGDPENNGQDKNTLLAAILRVDVDGDDFPGDSSRNYSIPTDNPFVGVAGADEIWVYGLRNPWRFWIDQPTGRLYIGDVGQGHREEVTVLEPSQKGANLGWNRLEGTRCYPSGGSCSTAGTVLPQVEYSTVGGASVTGGVVYRGSKLPGLYGTYFYGDFIRGWVRSFEYDGTVDNHFDWSNEWNTNLISSFGVDGVGNLYVVSLSGNVWQVKGPPLDDEIFFYRPDGTFRYYDIGSDAKLGAPILSGSGYSANWGIITAVDLEGDGLDEMFFYRSPGVFRYYDLESDGTIGAPINSGTGYSHKWDSAAGIDIDGDGQDEMFFYDRETGLRAFYDIDEDANLGAPLVSGEGFSLGWTSITAVDLNGDGQDEMLFYRNDGTFKYYETRPNGNLGPLISGGTGYSNSWSSISSIDLDGDGNDELLFYRNDGTFKYYNTSDTGISSLILSGTGYSTGWTTITSVNLD